MHKKTLLFALLAALLQIKVESMIRVQRFTCIVYDNSTIQDVECFSKPVNRSVALMNISAFFPRPVSNIFLNGELFKRTVISYKPFLVNVTENFCDYLDRKRGGVYLRSVMRLFLPYSNVNHSCPYYGHVYGRNMPVEMDHFLSVWPVGEYKLDLRFSEGSNLFIVIQVFFEVK